MLLRACPKLPMRNKTETIHFYRDGLGFRLTGEYDDYLLFELNEAEVHFFLSDQLDPHTNDGQVYIRVKGIDALYHQLQSNGIGIHPNGNLQNKPWGVREFSVLDPDHNLLTFGEYI